MKRFRDPHWALIFVFLAILALVPSIQVVLELSGGNGIGALELFGQRPTAENLRAFEQNMEQASWARRVCRPWLQFANFSWLKEGGEKAVLGTSGWYFYKPGLRYMLARPEAPRASETNDPVAAIVDFRDELAALGIHLLVMPVPNKDSIYPDRLTSRAKSLRGVLAPRTREVLDRIRSAGVEVIDLFHTFGEARTQNDLAGPPLYLAQDTHWSPAGVDLAAKTVAQRLTHLGWIRPGEIDYRESPAPVRRLGDIVRMMQSPLIERHLSPENVSSVRVIRDDTGQPYRDEAGAEILILGDSFMRIYQQDEPDAAGFIAHLAKELKQPMMSLVNDGGGATLVREELRLQPLFLAGKKVVLWEFVERDIGLGVKGWPRVPAPKVPAKPSKPAI